MSVRLHLENRLHIPDPSFMLFGATLINGGVRVWASANPGRITLTKRGGSHVRWTARLDGEVDDVISFDGTDFSDALRKVVLYFNERQELEP